MLELGFRVLILCGITVLRLDLILSSDVSSHNSYFDGRRLDDIRTDIILLSDPENIRTKRDTNSSGSQVTNSTESSEISDPDLRRGYSQSNEFLNDVDISEDTIKNTIQSHNHSISSKNETTKYYQTDFLVSGDQYFRDLDLVNHTGEFKGLVQEHSMLSQSYRRAATINLKFRFPFYGHEVENITIATGGFLYTGDYVHSWLAATQYIAPLMANFDTSNNQEAKIRYLDTGELLVVEWKDVYLQEREKEGPFTFQVTLNKTGDIYFAYYKIPLAITTIQDEEHPVKVGLSDAYIIDRTIFFVRRKTIYEYHRVNLKNENISSHTAIVFKALFTCNTQKTCSECLASRGPQETIECKWCPSTGRCSDGMDRNRQDWITNGCDKSFYSNLSTCTAPPVPSPQSPAAPGEQAPRSADPSFISTQDPAVSTGGLTAVVILVSLVLLTFGWIGYAYFYPHTWSGQILIKYRPGAWRWRQGGTRYTAASIHM